MKKKYFSSPSVGKIKVITANSDFTLTSLICRTVAMESVGKSLSRSPYSAMLNSGKKT